MKINYDKIADAVYFSINKGKINSTLEMNERMIVDLDKSGKILGFELLDASSQMGKGVTGLEQSVAGGIPVNITSNTPLTA